MGFFDDADLDLTMTESWVMLQVHVLTCLAPIDSGERQHAPDISPEDYKRNR